MLWLKLLIGVCIVAFCVFLGYLAASKYRSRRDFYTQFHAFNERYCNELAYARKPLGEFLAQFGETGDFYKSLQRFAKTRTCAFDYSYLTREEREGCVDYCDMLGRGDSFSQSGYFSSKRGALSEKKAESEKEAKARGELYLKLGLLAGLAFVILIV